MKRLTSILAAALTLAACSPADPADQYRSALPTSGTLTIQTSGTGDAGSGALVSKAAINGKSEFAMVSYNFAAGVNGGVAAFLYLIHSITWWQATSCDDQSCTWGPGSSPNDLNDYRLVVTKVSADNYDYVLSAARKDPPGSPFLDIVVGHAHTGAFAHRGDGQFSVKFDNDALLAHHPLWLQSDFGTLDVRYDSHGELQNQVVWRNTKYDDDDFNSPDVTDPVRANVYFDFDANQRDLLVAFETIDLREKVALPEKTMTLHTQWTSAGAGRADVWFQDDTTATFTRLQCWGGAPGYAQAYDSGDATNYPDVGACIPEQQAGLVEAFPTLPEPLP
jgi:hypothetical protein